VKNTLLLTIGLTTLIFAGCSSTPPSTVDTGAIRANSYSFIAGGQSTSPEFADRRHQVHAMIQDSITQNLSGRGLSKLPKDGDITVAYLVVVGNNASTEAISTYFGYGRDAVALQEKAHDAYTSTDNPNRFEAGTLLIDIIDAKTFKLLKRSFVVRPLLRNPNAEVQAERIQEAVDAALKDLRLK
jgi:hypothetical protein